MLGSTHHPKQIYIGFTQNIQARINAHNKGRVPHTSKFKPWTVLSYTSFSDRTKALAFEKYLKSGSGRQFIYKHFV